MADTLKSLIGTVTIGSNLEIHTNMNDMMKDLISLAWQTGFPLNIPAGASEKTQAFYARVTERAYAAPVDGVPRKTLDQLRQDMDAIIDSVVAEIRASPDGIYTDMTQIKVNGVPIEDALVKVGQQLRAYGVDIYNYKNIAQMVLGVPVLPNVASAMMGATRMLPMTTITDNLPSMPSMQSALSLNLLTSNLASRLPSVSSII